MHLFLTVCFLRFCFCLHTHHPDPVAVQTLFFFLVFPVFRATDSSHTFYKLLNKKLQSLAKFRL